MSSVIYGRGPMARSAPVVWQETEFGDMLVFDMPDDTDMIIVCESCNTGMKPRMVLLPHQLYRETIEQCGNDIVLVPANCEDYIYVKIGN